MRKPRTLISALVALAAIAAIAQAQEPPTLPPDAARARLEAVLREQTQLIRDIAVKLEQLEKRVAELEKKASTQGK